ncbi:MAG: methyltransferase domain-containing protein [Bacteroidales bacterium]|nr:methyltransferase domain-containing protein [Bacteroidales bacterium]
MKIKDYTTAPGHWLLARMGKRVLRPGGRSLTQFLLSELAISPATDIVEFAPGLGFTASLALKQQPQSYVGIDTDKEVINMLKQKLHGTHIRFLTANAGATVLEAESKDKVFGEAMLTMQNDSRKKEIVQEAYRILKKGGLYAIHELALRDTDEKLEKEIRKQLATVIQVNARPLRQEEWETLLKDAGFMIRKVTTNEMYLLEKKRIVEDEGWLRSIRIVFNIMIHPNARKRVSAMRKTFRTYQKNIHAIAIIAEKTE